MSNGVPTLELIEIVSSSDRRTYQPTSPYHGAMHVDLKDNKKNIPLQYIPELENLNIVKKQQY